jgi:hypothetical protein
MYFCAWTDGVLAQVASSTLNTQHSELKRQCRQAGRASMHQKGEFPEKERRGRERKGERV